MSRPDSTRFDLKPDAGTRCRQEARRLLERAARTRRPSIGPGRFAKKLGHYPIDSAGSVCLRCGMAQSILVVFMSCPWGNRGQA